MSKRIIDIICKDSCKSEDEALGVRLVCETMTDGSKVYQIEFTKPVAIICTSAVEAFDMFDSINKLWLEKLD